MSTIDLHQRIAVVTGAAKGIGRAIAARLLTSGAAVCLWDRAPEALTSTALDLAALGTVEAVTVDVTDPVAVSAATMRASQGRTIRCGNIRWRPGGRWWRSICWAPFTVAGPSCPSCSSGSSPQTQSVRSQLRS